MSIVSNTSQISSPYPGSRIFLASSFRIFLNHRKQDFRLLVFSLASKNTGQVILRDRIIGVLLDHRAKYLLSFSIGASEGVNLAKVDGDSRASTSCLESALVKCLLIQPIAASDKAAGTESKNSQGREDHD